MERKKDIEDIEDKIRSNSIEPAVDGDIRKIECDVSDHQNNNNIREGNKTFVVIERESEEDEWILNSVACWKCNVKQIVETIDNDNSVAVVETTLEIDQDTEQMSFENPVVWELMSPTT